MSKLQVQVEVKDKATIEPISEQEAVKLMGKGTPILIVNKPKPKLGLEPKPFVLPSGRLLAPDAGNRK